MFVETSEHFVPLHAITYAWKTTDKDGPCLVVRFPGTHQGLKHPNTGLAANVEAKFRGADAELLKEAMRAYGRPVAPTPPPVDPVDPVDPFA